jgi:dTDP-4-dehydrorhamnose 3,5-epimerase-like enzyme
MIDGVKIVPLRQIVDERGKIMHMLKATDHTSWALAKSISRAPGRVRLKPGTFTRP